MRPRLLPFERAWTDAAFDAIFPDGTALPHGIARLGPADYFDDLLREVPLEQSLGLRVALWIVGLAPLFTIGRFGTIASIDAASRGRVLEALVTSPRYAVRQLTLGLKAMAAMLVVQSPAVRAAMTEPAVRQDVVALGRGATSKRPHAEGERKASHDHAAE
jgi:hypothetical protein